MKEQSLSKPIGEVIQTTRLPPNKIPVESSVIPKGTRSPYEALKTIRQILEVCDRRPITIANFAEIFELVEPYREHD